MGTEHPKWCEETGDPKRSDWGLSTRSGAKKTMGCVETYWSTSPVCGAGTGRHRKARSFIPILSGLT
ncbi:MAG TPA: hypothetical protein ENN79_02870 [Desulfobacteraceae bacterium]|nr:hypothetical protein [Desulfobacteraceae bacterium]